MSIEAAGATHIVLSVDWSGYQKILEGLGESHLRVTYDHGNLELMVPSRKHERTKKAIGMRVEALLQTLEIDFEAGGSMTFNRQELDRGLEPDECYWIANHAQVAGRDDYDPRRDPPPDLAIEVEITNTILDRIEIYRSLGVPEVWRHTRDNKLVVLLLDGSGTYHESPGSRSFPTLPISVLEHHIEDSTKTGLTRSVNAFRQC